MSEARIETAEQILRSAGEILVKYLGYQAGAREKQAEHFATPVDTAVDQMVINSIRQKFPDDQLFTEESLFVGGESAYLWVVDPVDGTSNLRLGIPYAATGIALQRFGETVFSGVYNPFLDEMVVAEKGSGAFLNGERLRVSDKTLPAVGYYIQGYRVPPPVQLEVLRVMLPAVHRILHTWAPTLDWCNLARGRAEFIIGYDTEAEDLLQGRLIVEEAGGQVSTWDNRQIVSGLTPRQRVSIIASNAATHEQICFLLERTSVGACLRTFISPAEDTFLNEILDCLDNKLQVVSGSIGERISAEIGLPETVWGSNRDLKYLVTQAEVFFNNPRAFLARIVNGVAPHLSGEKARQDLLQALRSVVETWDPEEQLIEVGAQAIEIAANDARLYDRMQNAGYPISVIEDLKKTLPKDSFAVGLRLKRNAFREVQALEGDGNTEPLGQIYCLAELALTTVTDSRPQERTASGFGALIITGGRGTRLRSSVPKGLLPLGHRPLISYTIDALRAAGVNRIAIVIGYKDELHRSVLSPDFTLIMQEEQLGTAHAIMVSKPYFMGYQGPLLVCYSDAPFIESQTLIGLINKHRAEGATMTFLTTDRKKRPEFGRVFRRDGEVSSIGQTRFDAMESNEVDAGFYCFNAPEFWEYLGQIQNANNRREFLLTEIVTHLAEDREKIETYFIDDIVQTIGINRPSEFIEADRTAYVRAKSDIENDNGGHADPELYWKLRFYEAYGGIRAEGSEWSLTNQARADDLKTVVKIYDDALEQEIGPIFSCPEAREVMEIVRKLT